MRQRSAEGGEQNCLNEGQSVLKLSSQVPSAYPALCGILFLPAVSLPGLGNNLRVLGAGIIGTYVYVS